jgi:hypothetical protein
MTKKGHLTVAWEMLSSVVVLRAKAKENKFHKLLSSLHGVEVELARIIAGTDAEEQKVAAGETEHLAESDRGSRTVVRLSRGSKRAAFGEMAIARKRAPSSPDDQQVHTHSRKYLANARLLRTRGESAALGRMAVSFDLESGDEDGDALWEEQTELSLTLANLKASTFEGLVDKAHVLADLVEEGTEEPVQLLAQSIARDIIAMRDSHQLAS